LLLSRELEQKIVFNKEGDFMFWERFSELCAAKGIKPTPVADEMGFSRGSVSYWKKNYKEGKDSKPAADLAAQLAEFFGVSIDYLLDRTDDPVDYESPELIAELPDAVLDHFDGDVQKAYEAQKAIEEDAMREGPVAPTMERHTGTLETTDLFTAIEAAIERRTPQAIRRYRQLDSEDQKAVCDFIEFLLGKDKYKKTQASTNLA